MKAKQLLIGIAFLLLLSATVMAAGRWEVRDSSLAVQAWINASGVGYFVGDVYENGAQLSTLYVARGDWTTIDDYPSACGAGQYVTAVGDTLTCSTPAGSGNSTEQMQDAVMAAIDDGTQTGITVTYQDGTNVMDFVVALGTSIESGEITDSEIMEVDLNSSNAPTDNYVLTYNAATGGFSWDIDATGAGGNSTEEVQDAAWDIAGGTQTDITVTYQDGTDDVDFVVSDKFIRNDADDSFSADDVYTLPGGTNFSLSSTSYLKSGNTMMYIDGSGNFQVILG